MVVDFLSAWSTPKKRRGSTDSRSDTREEFWTRRARLSHSRRGLGYLKSRKRERGMRVVREEEDRLLYGVGSRSPVSWKGERHRKKLVRVEWCAIVRRKQCPTLSSFIFSGRWRRKEEGGRQVSPGKRRSPLSRAQRGPLFYALSGFMVYELARGLARSILIRGQVAVVLISLQ